MNPSVAAGLRVGSPNRYQLTETPGFRTGPRHAEKLVPSETVTDISDYSFVFEVEGLFKGALSSEVAVLTGIGRGDCGYQFQVGEKYLVYAYGKNGLETNICTRTTNLSRADADLGELGAPKTIFVPVTKLSLSTTIAISFLAFLTGIVIGSRWLPRPLARRFGLSAR